MQFIECDYLVSKAGSVIGGKPPSPALIHLLTDKLGNILFIIECDSSAVMNMISRVSVYSLYNGVHLVSTQNTVIHITKVSGNVQISPFLSPVTR